MKSYVFQSFILIPDTFIYNYPSPSKSYILSDRDYQSGNLPRIFLIYLNSEIIYLNSEINLTAYLLSS